MQLKTCFVIITFILSLSLVSAYKYLVILPTIARSHYIVGSSLAKALARKGHDVTVISPFPQKKPLPNYHDIDVASSMSAMTASTNNLFKSIERSIVENIISYHNMGIDLTNAVLSNSNVQDLMKSNQTFDAVICEVFLSEALYGLSDHFKAPLIGLGTFGALPWNTDMVGSPSPPSYVPSPMLPLTDRMTLLERIGNLAYLTFERLFLDYHYLPRQVALYKQYFPNAKRDLLDIRKNAALVLLNQHVSLSFNRPYVANQIEVGGMHISHQQNPLPADIQRFIDEAKHGVVYFSMGSNLKSKDLPLDKRQAILRVFRGLKQRVLWKFENTNLPNKPDNVFISDWFPQDDILAHPNVKAFITHGGLLSTTESIYHAKPVVGVPIFGDQFLNMARAEKLGYGIKLNYLDFTEEKFKNSIERILNEPSFTKVVKGMSERYRDQPIKPIDLAVHWVEHVARHKGADYLHCSGLDLNFIQYHNIDAMLILFGGLLILFVGVILTIRRVWHWATSTAKSSTDKKLKRH